jgi:hypothetical protein
VGVCVGSYLSNPFNFLEMTEIKFNSDAHECELEIKGNWIVFTCPLCPNYRRKMHMKTGEIVNENTGKVEANHSGVYISQLVQDFNSSQS